MTPLVSLQVFTGPMQRRSSVFYGRKCKLQGIQRSSQAVRSHWPDIIKFNLPHFSGSRDYACFFFFFFFLESRNVCERFTSQDTAAGVHRRTATYSVSCLLSSSSQPSCCPCCFLFFFFLSYPGWNADVCSFLCLGSLGFRSKNLQFKCNYCLSSLCHWQLH